MKKYLFIAVFISGATSLAVEMASSRLLGNIFGTSNLVWASIIGLILIYLAVGYFFGGKWADRSPNYTTFFTIMVLSGFAIAIVPLASKPVLRFAADAFDSLQLPLLAGSFVSVFILLSIPVTLLGVISPFAIRLSIVDGTTSGKVSGTIYAVSTIGSFIGTFLPDLILIPVIGTYKTFLAISVVQILIGLIGFILIKSKKHILLFGLLFVLIIPAIYFWGISGTTKATNGQIYETESSYNYIQVLEYQNYRYLRLNEGQGVHSVYHPDVLNYYGAWEQVLSGPFFNAGPISPDEIQSMAVIGLAAGTTARQSAIVFDNIHIDGYELDQKIVDVGYEYFEMDIPELTVYVEDGRWGLFKNDKQYQVISIDAYRPPYIPWHLTTSEFFKLVYDHLTDDGVVVINVGRSFTDRSLINSLSATLETHFPSVHVMDLPNTFNSIVFGTKSITDPINLVQNYEYLKSMENVHPLLLETMKLTIDNLQPAPEGGIVFTDDKAPIEWITNRMVLDFVLSDQIEEIQ